MRALLADQLAPYRRRHPDARWLDPASWHVTLLFLGSVPAARLAEVIDLAEGALAGQPAFRLAIDGGGGHVGRHGSVAWLVVRRGAREVVAMGDRLLAACPAGLTMGAPPRRAPSAHLSVARRLDERLVVALRDRAYGPLEAAWTAERIVLYESHLGPAGSTYAAVHEVPLTSRLTPLG